MARCDTHSAPAPAGGTDQAVHLPEECISLVLTHSVRILHTVIHPSDAADVLPIYMDTLAEWKDFCSRCKSDIKYVLSEVAAAAPQAALRALLHAGQAGMPQVQAVSAQADEAAVSSAVTELDVRCFCLCLSC